MTAASLFFALAGFSALAASMRRHAGQIGLMIPPPRSLRYAGWALLIGSWLALFETMGWRMVSITWVGQCGLAAGLCIAILIIRPRALPAVGTFAAGLGFVILLFR